MVIEGDEKGLELKGTKRRDFPPHRIEKEDNKTYPHHVRNLFL